MLKGTLDFETDPFEHGADIQPFASCVWFDAQNHAVIWSEGDCARKTFDIISELPRCELYAHNGGKFDFWYLLPWVENQDVKIINGRIAKIQIGACTLIDSYLLIAEPLDKYKKTKIDYVKFKRDVRHRHREEILGYLVDDCKYLLELVNGFHAILSKKLTIGGAAMKSIKDRGVEIKKQDAKHDALFRPFYFGGRVQNFFKGIKRFKEPGYLLDINSAYADAMRSFHPHGKAYSNLKKIPKNKTDGAWFAIVDAKSKGALPFKLKSGELVFPDDGETRLYLATGWEILAGLATGTLEIDCIHELLKPKEKITFAPFIDHHYMARLAAKESGDKLGDLVHKKSMNSGYGKLASNPEKFKDWVIADIGVDVEEYEGGRGFEWYNDIMGRSLWCRPSSEDQKDQGYYDVATGASITGYVRSVLWRGLCAVKEPLYCDTDSIFCADPGNLELSAKKLGAWKTEMRVKQLAVAGKKIYAAKGMDGSEKTASKGARLKYSEIIELVHKGTMEWKNNAPSFSIARGVHYITRNLKC